VDQDTAILQIGGEGQQKLHKEQGTNRISDRGGKATLRTTDGTTGDNRNFRTAGTQVGHKAINRRE
jgi:hypothetical protein